MPAKPDPFCQILSLSREERRALITFLQASADGAGQASRNEAGYFEDVLLLSGSCERHSRG